jgi:phage protein D
MAHQVMEVAFDGEPVDEAFYADVATLTVEEDAELGSILRLRQATRQADDGSWSYLEDDRLALLTRVSARLGFGGDLEPVFDGYVTAVDLSLGSEPGNGQVEVRGMDTSVLLSLEEKVATWPDLTDSDIVQQIVGGYGVRLEAEPTPTTHQEADTTVVQRGSDLEFVRLLARRNGYEFYFETDRDSGDVVAYFRPPQLDAAPQRDLAVRFGDQSNLRSFTAHLSAQRPLNVKAQQLDVKANSPNTAEVGDTSFRKLGRDDLGSLVGGPLGSLVTPAQAPAQMLVLGPPTSNATELRTIAQAVRDEAGWFITAGGEVNGEAYQAVLRPHRLVLVKGAGSLYSGAYYLTRVVHEVHGDGGYGQRFEGRRNARGLDGGERFGEDGLALPLPGV